jgi:hypothetical protein
MAVRVQTVARGNVRYVSVVEDVVMPDGTRTARTLQSFGQETPEALVRAHQFKSAYETAAQLAPQAREDKEMAEALVAVFGIILGVALLAALLSKK